MEITLVDPNMATSSSAQTIPQSNNEDHDTTMADITTLSEQNGPSGEGAMASSVDGTHATKRRKRSSKGGNRPTQFSGELVEDTRGSLYWRVIGEGDETLLNRATFFTKEIRLEMLDEMAQLGHYDIPRPSGLTEDDKTTFHPDQQEWGPDRSNWPDILCQYNKQAKDKKRVSLPQTGKLMWKGSIVIDKETNKPLRDYPNIPLCLSSREEGWSLEAMARQDGRITHEDFMHRMPFSARRPDIKSISMRRSRFRWSAGCKSWVSRSASGSINQYLDNLVPKEYQDSNCTRGWRDLTDLEVEDMKAPSKGKYPERSRHAKDQSTRAEGQSTESENRDEKPKQKQVAKLDFRYQMPSKPWEQRALQRALAPTRLVITDLIKHSPPPTNEEASYHDQLNALYNYYVIHSLEGSHVQPLEEMHPYPDAWIDGFPEEFFRDDFDVPAAFGSPI